MGDNYSYIGIGCIIGFIAFPIIYFGLDWIIRKLKS